jgi:hypothetical protein
VCSENTTTTPASALRDYLVGKLDESARDEVERSFLESDEVYDELLVVEDELIDDYVCGRLRADERRALAAYLERLPEGRRKLAFARGLNMASNGHARHRWRNHPALAVAAAVVVIVVGGTWAIRELVTDLHPEPERAAEGHLLGAPASPAYPYVVLRPGIVRGSGERTSFEFSERLGIQEIRLDVAPTAHDSYRATIHDADQVERLVFNALGTESLDERILIRFAVSSRSLPPGDYFISLSGLDQAGIEQERLARYEFRVARSRSQQRPR